MVLNVVFDRQWRNPHYLFTAVRKNQPDDVQWPRTVPFAVHSQAERLIPVVYGVSANFPVTFVPTIL
jgi:hypothetical protein